MNAVRRRLSHRVLCCDLCADEVQVRLLFIITRSAVNPEDLSSGSFFNALKTCAQD